MNELFTRYPIGSRIMMEGDSFTIIGYEIYENAQYLICKECGYTHTHRINVERIEKG